MNANDTVLLACIAHAVFSLTFTKATVFKLFHKPGKGQGPQNEKFAFMQIWKNTSYAVGPPPVLWLHTEGKIHVFF